MDVLLLILSGPLQSWGADSRFTTRSTRREPTRSAITGMLACAMGLPRTASLDRFRDMCFGVRVDQRGELVEDMQTARPAKGKAMPVTHRRYLADASFLVAIGASRHDVDTWGDALSYPVHPLYLGRRSCPPDTPVRLCTRFDTDIATVLDAFPWTASPWYRRQYGTPDLQVVRDVLPSDTQAHDDQVDVTPDVAVSFGPVRQYASRQVLRYRVPNPSRQSSTVAPDRGHDPMAVL